jgi:hypothetical protein
VCEEITDRFLKHRTALRCRCLRQATIDKPTGAGHFGHRPHSYQPRPSFLARRICTRPNALTCIGYSTSPVKPIARECFTGPRSSPPIVDNDVGDTNFGQVGRQHAPTRQGVGDLPAFGSIVNRDIKFSFGRIDSAHRC